ncbi:hypothetical protein [Bradyrhizobium guangzhouense]|uniref:Uncharacterized protein n=1 Tax=Bradyrhizobium guangzhouense TaxID=1325095 RepID=A0AAE5WX79_9BRAD|nr:hypothetical protein [Bradyrhizobium guangzhouense]QAU44767.1 hypothetical protein XH91_04995 [Bradyrhizobium guangzhouense]RXH05055.1 hypothetical protein EAS56_35920 [Bradyrhizobium guangzhouense]
MGTFYSDGQIQEAIAALEGYSPGIWEAMKKMAFITDPQSEEERLAKAAISRALIVVLPEVSFVAQAEDKFEAENRLIIDVGNALRGAIDAAGSQRN